MFANQARVLIAEAVPPEELDAGELRERLDDAQRRTSEAEEGSATHEGAQREQRRLEAFLQIAEQK